MRSTRLVMSIVVCLLLISARTIFAQAEIDCANLVQQALSEFKNNCSDLENGSFCFGHKTVQAETNSNQSTMFGNPADRLQLTDIKSISSSAANRTSGDWGLAFAELPQENSSEAIQLVLMGEAKLTLSHAKSTDLNIKLGFGSLACNDAPSLLAVGTPDNTITSLKINGADIQTNSLIIFQQESTNSIKAIVYSGSLAISGGSTAQAGQTLAGVTDNNGTILFWAAPRPTTDGEKQTAASVTSALISLGTLKSTPLPPTPTPIPPTEATPANSSCGESITHVVQVGENLFRIALRYGTTIDAISRANGISNPNQIIVGQALIIPCGTDSGTSSVALGETSGNQATAVPNTDNVTPVPTETTNQTVDCSNFNNNLPSNVPPAFQQLFNQFCQQ